MKVGWLAVFLLASIPVTAWAGPFDKARVPRTASWVVHLDAERLVKSENGRQLLAELGQGRTADRLDAFQNIFGLDLGRDLKAITAYGPDVNSPRGVAVASGNFDPKAIAAQLLQRTGYSQQHHGARTIHGWITRRLVPVTDASGATTQRTVSIPGFVCLPSPSLLVISQNADDIRNALDVLDGKQDTLASKYILDQMRLAGANTLLIGATELGKTGVTSIPGEIGRNIQTACLFIGELGKTFVTIVESEAPSAQAAAQLKLVVMGLVASAVLQAGSKPDLARLARNTKVSSADNRVTLTLRYPAEEFVTMLKKGTLFSSADYLLRAPKAPPAGRPSP